MGAICSYTLGGSPVSRIRAYLPPGSVPRSAPSAAGSSPERRTAQMLYVAYTAHFLPPGRAEPAWLRGSGVPGMPQMRVRCLPRRLPRISSGEATARRRRGAGARDMRSSGSAGRMALELPWGGDAPARTSIVTAWRGPSSVGTTAAMGLHVLAQQPPRERGDVVALRPRDPLEVGGCGRAPRDLGRRS